MEMSKFNATSDQEQFLQSKKVDSIESLVDEKFEEIASLVADVGGDLYFIASATLGTTINPTVQLTGKYMFVIQYIKSGTQCLQVGGADNARAFAAGAPNIDFNVMNINSFMAGAAVSNVAIMRFKLK